MSKTIVLQSKTRQRNKIDFELKIREFLSELTYSIHTTVKKKSTKIKNETLATEQSVAASIVRHTDSPIPTFSMQLVGKAQPRKIN